MTPQELNTGYNNFEAAFETFINENENWKYILDNMKLLHLCCDSHNNHFESQSQEQKLGATQDILNSTKTNDFESNQSDLINSDLLNHLLSIHNSCSIHITDLQSVVNQCLQEAQLRGMFTNDNEQETMPDQSGHLANEVTFLYEQDWQL